MPIQLGNTNITKAYLGATEVTQAYLGSTLVFGGAVSTDFIIQVKTDNIGTSLDTQFTIPTTTGTYLYDVDWGDGNTDIGVTANITHTYSVIGTYDVSISGAFPRIYFNNALDYRKLIEIKQWGDIKWTSFKNAFFSCQNLLNVSATDIPDMSICTNLNSMFYNTTFLQPFDVNSWDTSLVTDFGGVFRSNSLFDSSLAGWVITSGTNFNNIMANSTGLSTPNYDATLISWAAQAPLPNESPNFGGSKYTLGGAAEAARQELIDTYLWTITDGGGI